MLTLVVSLRLEHHQLINSFVYYGEIYRRSYNNKMVSETSIVGWDETPSGGACE